jgi:hypothetical protein
MKLEFGPWLPDLPALGNPGVTDAKNVIPFAGGYLPWYAINPYSTALTARCQGAWAIKDNAATVHAYAGDATKLYLLSGSTWTDASRLAGGAYATPADGQWRFVKYGSLGIAVNGADAPQSITLASGANWAALSGSPPTGKHIAVIREFVVIGNITAANNRVQWSASNSAVGWTVGTNESNYQDIPDGGVVQAIVGGEVGYVFQERQIVRMVRVPAPITFQFDVVEQARGALSPYCVVPVGNGVFYLAPDGFYFFDGVQSVPIGENGVDLTFFDEVNPSAYDRISAAVDPLRKMVFVAYPSGGGGLPNKILVFHWPEKRWSYIVQDCEIIYNHFSLGTGLDSISGTLEGQTLSFDSTAYQGGNQSIGAFNSSHKLSFFDGDTLEAVMTTAEGQLNERGRMQVHEVAPLIDTSAATIAMGVRETQSGTVTYGSESSQRSTGTCPVRSTGRFHRARVTVPAATSWNYAQGVDVIKAVSMGQR